MPQACTVLPHEIDHIRARKHHGPTSLENTCLHVPSVMVQRAPMPLVTIRLPES